MGKLLPSYRKSAKRPASGSSSRMKVIRLSRHRTPLAMIRVIMGPAKDKTSYVEVSVLSAWANLGKLLARVDVARSKSELRKERR